MHNSKQVLIQPKDCSVKKQKAHGYLNVRIVKVMNTSAKTVKNIGDLLLKLHYKITILNTSLRNHTLQKAEIQLAADVLSEFTGISSIFRYLTENRQDMIHILHIGYLMRKLRLWEETTEQDTRFGLLLTDTLATDATENSIKKTINQV